MTYATPNSKYLLLFYHLKQILTCFSCLPECFWNKWLMSAIYELLQLMLATIDNVSIILDPTHVLTASPSLLLPLSGTLILKISLSKCLCTQAALQLLHHSACSPNVPWNSVCMFTGATSQSATSAGCLF